MITIGSLFSGIGGFELGLERAITNSRTIWQCEQNSFCRSILAKHWPGVKIYEDITTMDAAEVETPDILCGGFPCQDISTAGKGEGIHGKKSGLWWHMHALISRIRPKIIVLENVPAITFRGGREVLGSLADIGYDAEWTIISAQQFGAPHLRKRWFCIAYPNSKGKSSISINEKALERITSYPNSSRARTNTNRQKQDRPEKGNKSEILYDKGKTYTKDSFEAHKLGYASAHSYSSRPLQAWDREISQTDRERGKIQQRRLQESPNAHRPSGKGAGKPSRVSKKIEESNLPFYIRGGQRNYWKESPVESPLCSVDDGIPNRLARLKALGNAIVPQCSEYIGHCIVQSGLLEEIRR